MAHKFPYKVNPQEEKYQKKTHLKIKIFESVNRPMLTKPPLPKSTSGFAR